MAKPRRKVEEASEGVSTMTKWSSISVDPQMYKEIEELIFQKGWLGYRSKAEFVRTAIRHQLDRDKMKVSSQSREGKGDLY